MPSFRSFGFRLSGMSNDAAENITTTEGSSRPPETPDAPPAEGTPTPGSPSEGAGSGGLPTSEDVAAIIAKAEQADAFRERYLRSVAELENFRKRAARERQEAVQFASQGLLEKLVPVLDNLDMALTAVAGSAQGASVDTLKTGVEMVLGQLRNTLRDAGLEEIQVAGQPFNPSWHEAVSQVETSEVPEGTVVQQLRKGYRLHQRLLRPATVVVARAPQSQG